MKLIWILSDALESRNGRLFSPIGSHRLRCIEPAAALVRREHRIVLTRAETLHDRLESPKLQAADAVIVAKQFTDITSTVQMMKARGHRIVVDLCDDVLGLDHLRGVYDGLLELADACTAASPALAERIRAARSLPVMVVPDCVEGKAQPVAFDPPAVPSSDRPIRLLWFGQPGNLDTLDAALPDVGRRFPGVEVTIVTTPSAIVVERFPDGRDGVSIRCRSWSPETMADTLRACDLVLIPSLPAEDKRVKSSNRVATALWAGRLPIAFPLPSYQPFADCALLTETMADGIAWALAHRTECPARIARGQALIRERFTPDAVAVDWEAALNGIVGHHHRDGGPSLKGHPIP